MTKKVVNKYEGTADITELLFALLDKLNLKAIEVKDEYGYLICYEFEENESNDQQ